MTSRCMRLRVSAIEKKASRRVPGPTTSSMRSSVRADSTAGNSGMINASAASNTLSDPSEMLGGQSRKTYS